MTLCDALTIKTAAQNIAPCGIIGDLDNDGYITQADVDLALVWLSYNLTADQLKRIDVNGNGEADAGDLVLIQRYALGEITTFPACTPPVLTLTNVSFVSSSCVEFSECTPTNVDAPSTNYVTVQTTITVANANSKFKLTINYKFNGTAKSFITPEIAQNIGTVTQCISLSETWSIGNYTELTILVIDVYNG